MTYKEFLEPFLHSEEVTVDQVKKEIKQLLETRKTLKDYRKNRIYYDGQNRRLYFYIGGRKYVLPEEEILSPGKGTVVMRTKF